MKNAEEGAATVVVAVEDMFFAAKIKTTAEAIGRRVALVKSPDRLAAQLKSGLPSLIIVDLNSSQLDPIQLIQAIKSRDELRAIPVVGFLSHVQVDLKRRAGEAGCDYVLPRSLFTQKVAEILSGQFPMKS